MYISNIIGYFSSEIAICVCALELIIAILLQLRASTYIANWLSLLIFSLFTCITFKNYVFPSDYGPIESCGCFGELIHFSPLLSFIKSFLLCIVSTFSISDQRRRNKHLQIKFLFRKKIVFIICICIIPQTYSYLLMERINSSTYLLGYISICVVILLYFLYLNRTYFLYIFTIRKCRLHKQQNQNII